MKRKILIVDDEPDILELIEASLADHGFEVLKASDGLQALNLTRQENPDMIISDICMPGMTGYEFRKALKEIKAGIPILIISAHGDMSTFFESWDICGFLSKPFSEQQLIEKVLEAIGPEAEKKVALREAVAKRRKVLISGDRDPSVEKLCDFLISQGHTVERLPDEKQVIQKAWEFEPDFVFIQCREDTTAAYLKKMVKSLTAEDVQKKVSLAFFCPKLLAPEFRNHVPPSCPVFGFVNPEWLIDLVSRFMSQCENSSDPEG